MLRLWRRLAARVREMRTVPEPVPVRVGAAVPWPAPPGHLPVTGFAVEPLGGGPPVAEFDRADLAGAVAEWVARGNVSHNLVAFAGCGPRFARHGFCQTSRWDFVCWSQWVACRRGA